MEVTRSTKELTGPIMGMDITKEKMNSTKKCVKRDYKNQKKETTRTISEIHMTNKQHKRKTVANSQAPIAGLFHSDELEESVTNCFVSKASMNNPYSFGSVGSSGDSYS